MSRMQRAYLSDWPGLFTPEARVLHRQEQVVAAAKAIGVAASAQLRSTERIGAAQPVIIAELKNAAASSAEVAARIESASQSAADSSERLLATVSEIGSDLCLSLSEIRWLAAQSLNTHQQMLQVLRESRANEARQLVSQGVRHYVNEQYDVAEQRFLKALEYDTTDFQVLLNLAFIAIVKDDAVEARKYFKDALALPGNLDSAARAIALHAFARFSFAQGDAAAAAALAREAFAVADSSVEDVFAAATYHLRAGFREQGQRLLADAIKAKPRLFGRSLVDPALEPVKGEVGDVLVALEAEVRSRIQGALASARVISERLQRDESFSHEAELAACREMCERIAAKSESATYEGLLAVADSAQRPLRALTLLEKIGELKPRRARVNDSIAKCEEEVAQAERSVASYKPLRPMRIKAWFLWHFLSLVVLAMLILAANGGRRDTNIEVTLGIANNVWFLLGLAVWPLLRNAVGSRADRIEKEQAAERQRRSSAAAAATKRLHQAKRDIEEGARESEQALAQARALLQTPI